MKTSLKLVLSILLPAACFSGLWGQSMTPRFVDSDQSIFKIREGQNYRFGYLEVPEDRTDVKSALIRLPVYIFKSRSQEPKKDPVIYTVGGPGYTTMRAAQYMNSYKYLDDRDFILFEQRGTKYAQPHLDCPEWADAVYLSNLPSGQNMNADSLLRKAAQACRKRLVDNGINLDHYNTKAIAADLADLVDVLNIESYNLLTLSYSTKIAQVMMRDYPEKIRSVVMDSPLPLEVNYGEESLTNLMDALDNLLMDCERDSICASSYPAIRERFHALLVEKTKEPLMFEVKNPKSEENEMVFVKGEDLVSVFTWASTSSVHEVPFEINRLLNGDYGLIEESLPAVFGGPGSGTGMGMRLSVWCSEEQAFNDEKKVALQKEGFRDKLGMSPEVFNADICKIWSVKKANEIENMPVKSDIPVLLISGGYDNETPAKWASYMQKNFSNSFHLVFQGWKHTPTTNWSNQCAMIAANAFFNDPMTQPQPMCLELISTPIFKVE
jgi:pimeloyl-ACP methyl ester carboxylesterase